MDIQRKIEDLSPVINAIGNDAHALHASMIAIAFALFDGFYLRVCIVGMQNCNASIGWRACYDGA